MELRAAFASIDDFVTVQRATGGPSADAVELLQQAAGIEGAERELVAAHASAFGVSAETLLLGVIVGRLTGETSFVGAHSP